MVMWRKDCELCHGDAEPVSERVHEYVHTLVEAVAARKKTQKQAVREALSMIREAMDTMADVRNAVEEFEEP